MGCGTLILFDLHQQPTGSRFIFFLHFDTFTSTDWTHFLRPNLFSVEAKTIFNCFHPTQGKEFFPDSAQRKKEEEDGKTKAVR